MIKSRKQKVFRLLRRRSAPPRNDSVVPAETAKDSVIARPRSGRSNLALEIASSAPRVLPTWVQGCSPRGTAFGLLAMTVLASCAYVEPLVQDVNIISVPEERQIGDKIAAQISKEMKIVRDPSVTGDVQGIGNKLVAALPKREFPYQFYVVQDPTPNAFTIPGGSIYVHTGLLDFANENELAGVLAHEIGHAYARHPAKGLSRTLGVEYLSNLIFRDPHNRLKGLALQLAKTGVLTRYSRTDELQADELAHLTLRRAGFPTNGLLSFLKKLQSVDQGRMPLPFLSSHPPTPERIFRLEQLERGQLTPLAS